MGYDSFRQAAEQKLRDNWATTPIVYEDVPFRPAAGASWVEIKIMAGYASQAEIGPADPVYRSTDIIQIDINVPAGQGTKVIAGYADSIVAIFKAAQLDSGTVTVRGWELFKNKVGEWNRWTISFYCWRDQP